MNKGFFLLPLAIFLTGCKVDMDATIPMSGIFGKEIKHDAANIYVEVATCNSYDDSRKPSASLVEATKTIPEIIQGAEFKECFTKKFNSYAHFSFPIAYGPSNLIKESDPKIRVFSRDGRFVFLDISPSLKSKLEKYKKNNLSLGSFKTSDLNISLNIKNDMGADYQSGFYSVFIDNFPIIYAEGVTLVNGSTTSLKLSDVTIESAFSPAENKLMAYFMQIQVD
ncbi:hypothetical protein ACIPUF_18415 [Pectobacterium sp. CHL-2024]|uniref:DUF7424 family protein n=1 Tax=Pectobacterium sp. CHL-2024 TaxID=3377079 RepID=UPI003802AD68